MKSKAITIGVLALALGLGASVAHAQEASVSASASAKPGLAPLKARIEARIENKADKNREIRNERMEVRQEKRESVEKVKEEMKMERKETFNSTTPMFKAAQGEKREAIKKMQLATFEIRKDALVKELTISLRNLASIRTRINERIGKLESQGKTLTDAKAALSAADDKLAKAKVAVDAFASVSYTGTTTPKTGSTTPEINLDKPRKAGDAAIQSVKDARDALKKALELTAQSSGEASLKASVTATAAATPVPSSTN